MTTTRKDGGAGRNRTADRGFADLGLTTWRPRLRRSAMRKTLAAGRGQHIWSGRRDLNPRLRPWQGRTLPLSYSRSGTLIITNARTAGQMPVGWVPHSWPAFGLGWGITAAPQSIHPAMPSRVLRVHPRGNFIPHIPQRPIQRILHPLLQHFDRRPHRPNNSAADDPLRQLEMRITEELDVLIVVEQLLGDFMQFEELPVPAVELLQASDQLC